MARPTIISTIPTSGVTGVPTNIPIQIIFDSAVDLYRLKKGGLFVEAPDQSKAIGAGFVGLDPPQTDEDLFLTSSGFKGQVDVDYTFDRVNSSGTVVTTLDPGTGLTPGQLYRTRVTITPKQILASLTEHTVYIIGDPDTSDSYNSGISSVTVFDPVAGVGNTGTGETIFFGGFTGTISESFTVEITVRGAIGTAQYRWNSNRDATWNTGTVVSGYRLLRNGLRVKFEEDGIYEVGDTFVVQCLPPDYLDGSSSFSFTTSDDAPSSLPVPSGLVTGIDIPASSLAGSSGVFRVLETIPEDKDGQFATTLDEIVITFSADVDDDTIDNIVITSYAVDESIDGIIPYTGVLAYTGSVVGAELTLTLTAGQLFQNNLIVVDLDTGIADTSGNTLSEDYRFYFSTILYPFYAGVRAVRFRLGGYSANFTDEAIRLAIWEASLVADSLTPVTITDINRFNQARRLFVICYAAWLLASGQMGSSAGKRKRLADLDINHAKGAGDDSLPNDLQDCIDTNQPIVTSGGDTNSRTAMKPVGVVKGALHPDNPLPGRRITSTTVGGRIPVGNSKWTFPGSLRYYKGHSTRR